MMENWEQNGSAHQRIGVIIANTYKDQVTCMSIGHVYFRALVVNVTRLQKQLKYRDGQVIYLR